MSETMRFAYADPPYLGCGRLYKNDHPEAMIWDDPETHRRLIDRLCDEYPDGWALSCSTPSLRIILPMTPEDCRIGSWQKPFHVFKPNVNPSYGWEPVIWRGGRKRGRDLPTVPDFLKCNITLKKGLTGAKPQEFCEWVLLLLNAQPQDTLSDLFPGTGAMARAFDALSNAPGLLFPTQGGSHDR